MAPARVTLGVTSLLTLSTQHAKSQAALPPVSYLKAVDAFMSTCTMYAFLKRFSLLIMKLVTEQFMHLFISNRFVFMALMEYCLVNIILGDSDAPKPAAEPPKPEKVFDLAAKVKPY